MDGIFNALKEGAVTMQQGGGVGYDFSSLRPRGSPAQRVGTIATGPVSFMHIWDSVCATIVSSSARRGAMMATLRCDHPDIEEFVAAKSNPRVLRHFNLSVLITDAFMQAVRDNTDWPLVFPLRKGDVQSGELVGRTWSGSASPVTCKILKSIKARVLWEQIMRAAYDYAEPGILFVDRINYWNNLRYCEQISATNPCGEIPLPPYGACDLGSINLTQFVRKPFLSVAEFDFEALEYVARLATRMLDNVYGISRFPIPVQTEKARRSRRLGIGITGLADSFAMLGLGYRDEASLCLAADIMRKICHTAYRTSIEIAREKGSFPLLEKAKYLQSPFIQGLPDDIQSGIDRYGIRNSHLTAIAPAGTISLLANNISSGLEPIFDLQYVRRIRGAGGNTITIEVEDYAYHLYGKLGGDRSSSRTREMFLTASSILPDDHLAMQARLQPYIDSAISKTINLPTDLEFGAIRRLYDQAYDIGLKGLTVFRPNPVTGEVLIPTDSSIGEGHCCQT
jgi:ribonucleoside-diphosphate reductase alpha chain